MSVITHLDCYVRKYAAACQMVVTVLSIGSLTRPLVFIGFRNPGRGDRVQARSGGRLTFRTPTETGEMKAVYPSAVSRKVIGLSQTMCRVERGFSWYGRSLDELHQIGMSNSH